jgi:hypothetical protein
LAPLWPRRSDPMLLASVKRGREETLTFTRKLLDLDARGLATPCGDSEVSYLWLSEDIAERRKAVRLCRACPVLAECGEAARARGERFGVWGAVDFTRNPKARKGRDGQSSD